MGIFNFLHFIMYIEILLYIYSCGSIYSIYFICILKQNYPFKKTLIFWMKNRLQRYNLKNPNKFLKKQIFVIFMVHTMIKRLSLKFNKAQFILSISTSRVFLKNGQNLKMQLKALNSFKIFFIYESNYFNYEILSTRIIYIFRNLILIWL